MTAQQGHKDHRSSRGERLKEMLLQIRTGRRLRINDLAKHFNVSAETVRRDLEHLSAEGLVVRTLGGAAAGSGPRDPDFDVRMQHNLALREQASRAALPFVEPGDALFISSGITSLQFAQLLGGSGFEGLVITTSVRVANAVSSSHRARVILAPGEFDAAEQLVGGPETLAFLRNFNADKAIFGASGITSDGVTETRSTVAWNVRTMVECARQSILIADHTRFDQRQLEKIVPLAKIDILATDLRPSGELARAMEVANLEVALPAR